MTMTVTTTILDVRLNARLPAVQRGDRYEDPLAYWIENAFPGSRVTGGGTLRSPTGEPLSCAVRADAVGDAAAIETAVAAFLDDLGAPLGSSLTVGDRSPYAFGVQSGFAVYLDGQFLPQEVYAAHDINAFIDELHDSVVGHGVLQSYWEGPAETALYFYGPDADVLSGAMRPVLDAHPLAVNSRLERIA
jgi:sulfur carrier protein ThiS